MEPGCSSAVPRHLLAAHRVALGCLVLLGILLLLALCANLLPLQNPTDSGANVTPDAPVSAQHWLGTDGDGFDIFSRLVYGIRPSFAVGLIGQAITTILGLVFGLIAGYCGGWIDAVLARLTDLLFALPTFLLAFLVVGVAGPQVAPLAGGAGQAMLITAVFAALGWPGLLPSPTTRSRGACHDIAASGEQPTYERDLRPPHQHSIELQAVHQRRLRAGHPRRLLHRRTCYTVPGRRTADHPPLRHVPHPHSPQSPAGGRSPLMAQPSPGSSARVTAQALDVLFKLEAEHLAHLLPTRYGFPLAPIRRHLPTELPQLALHLERLDHVFELEDGAILHLEFEAAVSATDLRRFVRYGMALLEAYPGRRVQTVVFCGPRTRQAPLPIDGGTLPYRLDGVLVGDQDGEATLARLRALADGGQPWSEADRLDLVLLPLMRHEQDTEAVVRAGLTLAESLPAVEQPRAMGALLALAYHYVGEAALNRLMEGLMTTNLLAQVLAESMERGIAQGRAEEARVLLRRYLERRFGTIPPALEERIATSDAEVLTALFDRALAATAIEAI